MWNCPKCGEQIEDHLDTCWKCAREASVIVEPPTKRVAYQVFRGTFVSWDELFAEAAGFASQLPTGRLINISHSASGSDGVVTVWYWADEI